MRKNSEHTVANRTQMDLLSLMNIISNIPEYVYWKDCSGKYLGCNYKLAEAAGFGSIKDIVGKTDDDFEWGQARIEKLKEIDRKIIETGVDHIDEEDVIPLPLSKNGVVLEMVTHKAPLRDSKNNIIGIVGISTDVTERNRIRKELEISKQKVEVANAAKSEFLANMRHDIRIPFTGIIGMAEVLSKKAIDADLRKQAEILDKSSKALLTLLNDMIAYVDTESGNIPLLEEYVYIQEIIRQVVCIVEPELKRKQLKFFVNCTGSYSKKIKIDSSRVKRVLLNLISNAIKFTKAGSINLTIDVKLQEKSGDAELEISVADTGPGIPEEMFDRIFERFEKLSSSYIGKHKGSGLGLSIVKRFVEDLHGTIQVSSEVGKGSIFTCSIPCKIDLIYSHVDKQKSVEDKDSGGHITKSEKILLVEDSEIAQLTTVMILENENFDVDVAATGTEAVSRAREKNYDFILMDIGLPDFSGTEATKKIKKFSSVPIIALTGHGDSKHKAEFISAGMKEVLIKPLNMAVLYDIIKTMEADEKKEQSKPRSKKDFKMAKKDVINLEAFLQRYGRNEAYAEKMFVILLKSLREHKKVFMSAFNERDFTRLSREAHKLYGGLCFCGAVRLQNITLKFNEAVKNKAENIDELHRQLLVEIGYVIEACEEYLGVQNDHGA